MFLSHRAGHALVITLFVLVGAVIAPVKAAAAPTTSALERARVDAVPTPVIDWQPCNLGECATVALPLDYDDPTGDTIDIALTRIPARDPSRRIGSLFLNPGGPGASGAEFPLRATAWIGDEVRDRFDLIGVDPRGTNGSTNTQCFPTVKKLNKATSTLTDITFPVSRSEEKRFIKAATRLAKSCSRFGRAVASAISTAQVARDMDVLRRAVGDSQLTFLGFSYGTYLGQVYANMFPDRVRAIAIDAVINPVEWVGTDRTANTPMTVRMDSASSTSEALSELFRRCSAAPDRCGVTDPEGTFARVADRLRREPLVLDDAAGATTITYQRFVSSVVFALYSDVGAESIPQMAALLDQLQQPSLTPARRSQLSAAHAKTSERVLQEAAHYNNAVEQVPAIMCTDSRNPRRTSVWSALAASEDARAPYFGRFWLWNSVYCAGQLWGAYDEDAYAGPFDTVTANPILVVGSLHDPATSYRAAQATARLIPRSRLLTSTNWGHTAYGISACATAHVDRYLVVGTLPPEGMVCDDAHQPFDG